MLRNLCFFVQWLNERLDISSVWLFDHPGLAKYALPVAAGFAAAAWAYRVNIRNKRFDIIVACNGRYDTLYKDRIEISPSAGPDSAKVQQYFRRYWGLKSDQLDYWLAGGVDPQTFANWFHSTLTALRADKKVGKLGYSQSWDAEREDQEAVNATYVVFVDAVRDIARMDTINGETPETHARRQFAQLLFQMHLIETQERVFNRYLFDSVPSWIRGRLTVRGLVRTMPNDMQNYYWNLETAALKKRGLTGWLINIYLRSRWLLGRLWRTLLFRLDIKTPPIAPRETA